jgi:hypothetical protein
MQRNEESCKRADSSARVHSRRQHLATTSRQSAGLAVLVAAAALVLAACGGSADAPQVASLGKTSGTGSGTTTTTTAQPNGNATKLVDEWATCERSRGDIHQADPVIDSHGVINITIPAPGQGIPVGDPHDATGECSQYLVAAQTALRAADPVQDPLGVTSTAMTLKFANCMRANGVPDYPYPSGPNDSETNFIGSGVDPNSPAVMRVNDLCGKKLGLPLWLVNGWGPPGDITVQMGGPAPFNGTPPPCVFSKVDPCSGDVTNAAGSGGQGTGSGTRGNG